MAGLVPAIHAAPLSRPVGARHKAGHDAERFVETKKAGVNAPARTNLFTTSEGVTYPFTAAATSAAKSLVCFSMPSPSA